MWFGRRNVRDYSPRDFALSAVNSWYPLDSWHRLTARRIRDFIDAFLRKNYPLPNSTVVANLGSGGVAYDVPAHIHIHLDLQPDLLRNARFRVLADASHIPLRTASVDIVICVGGVLNLSPPELVIPEIGRILRPDAVLVLEYESSNSLEFARTTGEQAERTIRTFYNERELLLRVYNPSFIAAQLACAGLTVISFKTFHILSALVYRVTRKPKFAAKFALVDKAAANLPLFRERGCNVILGARRGQ